LSLTIEGGGPVRREPFPTRIQISAEELQGVIDLIKRCIEKGEASDRYGGIDVRAFEDEFV